MSKKLSIVLSVMSFILVLSQFVYAQSDEKNLPDDFDKRWNRASELMDKGEYKEAIGQYMILISALEKGQTRGACWYNVACAYMRLKNEKSALLSLGFAIKDGFRKVEQYKIDEDLKPLQNHSLFKMYIKLLEQNNEQTLDNLDIQGLVKKFFADKPDNDAKTKKMLKELSKYVDKKIEDLRKEAHKEIEDMIAELRRKRDNLKTPEVKSPKYQAYLGIRVENLIDSTRQLRQFYELPKNQGILINSVTPGSPAEKAGLYPLDIILMCNGKNISNTEQLIEIVKKAKPESTMTMLIFRNRKRIEKNIKLGKKLVKPTEIKPETTQKLNAYEYGLIGIRLDQLAKGGLWVLDVEDDSPAQKSGLQADDIIKSVDGVQIETLAVLRELLKSRYVGDILTIIVLRNEKETTLKLKIGLRKKVESKSTNPQVKIFTNVGNFTVELYEDEAPNTVANFIELCEKGFYDDIRFHRIIKTFMIQVGCPYAKGKISPRAGSGDAGYKFADEFNSKLKFDAPGLLAMANSGPNTNGSQIFITTGESATWLNGKHAIFGKVIKGMDVVYKIANTPIIKDPKNLQAAKPTKDVYIIKTQILKKRNHEYKVKKLK
ncbi:MAG: peptidylprolyl isomerase [Planctomycetes bacterium]|nr:peptidylprolyl isomerase [Planctomycetota bacterium]